MMIGAYTVVSRLGGGRYGVCYLAKDSAGRQVVLKRFRRRMWKKNQADNYHEAVILSGLSHKAVPRLLGVINQRCGYFFVLEYKSGQTLKALLCKTGVLSMGISAFPILWMTDKILRCLISAWPDTAAADGHGRSTAPVRRM